MTIENLLTMDGIDIILSSASLSNSDLNVFLKHWLAGGCPRLKLFSAKTNSVDLLEVIAGLEHNAVVVEGHRNFTSPFEHSTIFSFGFDIRRADDVTATVCKQDDRTSIIAVWPETTYN